MTASRALRRLVLATAAFALMGVGEALAASSADAAPLFVDCRGARGGAPTVILEAGAFGTSADWDLVLDDLAPTGRACAYDRAGLGDSPDRPEGRDVLSRAAELKGLLDQIGEAGPVILVGHSNGALYIQAFATLWPDRVAGLVYVNGVGVDDLDDPRLLASLRAERRASNLAVTAGRLGLSPMVADVLTGQMDLKPEAVARKRAGLIGLARLKVGRDEDRLIIPGLEAVRGLAGDPRHIPTVAIVGDRDPRRPLARAWRAAEIAPATRADHSWILDMPGASHVSPLTRDRAYVAAAVAWLRSALPGPDVGH
jgi:pimeloyl-ACP methyl ester carboxylesterase